jgi:hypothetical protein
LHFLFAEADELASAHAPGISAHDPATNASDICSATPTQPLSATNSTDANDADVGNGMPPFVGFQTARGGKIAISATALSKANALLAACDKDLREEPPPRSKPQPTEPATPVLVGFQTANDGKVSVSDAALNKAKAMLDDTDRQPQPQPAEPATPVLVGFQTANGGKVSISDAALSKARAMLDDTDRQPQPQPTEPATPVFVGFQTANGGKVSISDAALSQARAILDDADKQSNMREQPHTAALSTPAFSGFQTARGGVVSISPAALEAAKRAFDADNEVLAGDLRGTAPVVVGFGTGTGKPVDIITESVTKARRMLGQADADAASLSMPVQQTAMKVQRYGAFCASAAEKPFS